MARRWIARGALVAALMFGPPVLAHSGGHGHGSAVGTSHHGTTHHKSKTSKKHPRSKAARDAFMKHNPCPANGYTSGACPGYVVDHIKPLKRGGADAPSNMQWQTIEEGKAKDKWE